MAPTTRLPLALAAAAVLALLALATSPTTTRATTAQVCSLADNTVVGDVLFNYPSFGLANQPLLLTWTDVTNSQLRLAKQETNGGVVGYAWHNRSERIADGFVSNFTFTASNTLGGKAGDGFTYFVQNYGLTDLNGGTGAKLGAFGMPKSVSVGFDFCSDRPACTQQQVRITQTDANGVQTSLATPYAASGLTDGSVKAVRIVYGGRAMSNPTLQVYLGTTKIFDVVVGDLSQLFGSRFAFFGFTASTSWDQTAEILVQGWGLTMQPSDIAVKEYQAAVTLSAATSNPLASIQVPYGQVAKFIVQRRSSCGAVLTTPVPTSAVIASTLFQQPTTVIVYAEDYVYLQPNVTNNGDGSWTLAFQLPANFIGKFDLDVYVDGVRAAGMPWIAAVQSYKPAPPLGGLPIWALVLLILLTLLLIIVISYVVYRLQRYRKKLKENAEFIEAGKKQAELDRLEDGTTYSANPMVGTADDLRAQLEKNNAELERLRKRAAAGEDQNFTIEQLEKQRDQLKDEMNRLKKQAQEAGVEAETAGGFNQVQETGASKKRFGAQQVG